MFIRVTAYHLQQVRLQDAQDQVNKLEDKKAEETSEEEVRGRGGWSSSLLVVCSRLVL